MHLGAGRRLDRRNYDRGHIERGSKASATASREPVRCQGGGSRPAREWPALTTRIHDFRKVSDCRFSVDATLST